MNMTWVEIDGDRRQYAQSWAVSLFAHGMILIAAVNLIADLEFVSPQERFRWDVSVVEPPAPPQPQSQPSPPQPKPVEPVEPQEETVAQEAPKVVQREIKETTPQQVTRASVVTRSVVQHAQTVIEAAAMVAAPSSSAVQSPAPVETSSAVQPVQNAPVKDVSPRPTRTPDGPIQQASIKELPVRPMPGTVADYGWLMDTLWRQVDRLKRYPHTARVNRWEGKVVIRAVVKADGQVVDLTVEESSGHSVLDRDALAILKEASPLKLKHPLGQPQVVVHVPISYNLR